MAAAGCNVNYYQHNGTDCLSRSSRFSVCGYVGERHEHVHACGSVNDNVEIVRNCVRAVGALAIVAYTFLYAYVHNAHGPKPLQMPPPNNKFEPNRPNFEQSQIDLSNIICGCAVVRAFRHFSAHNSVYVK